MVLDVCPDSIPVFEFCELVLHLQCVAQIELPADRPNPRHGWAEYREENTESPSCSILQRNGHSVSVDAPDGIMIAPS